MKKLFEELCNKHKLTDEARSEFKKLFEKQIIDVFYKHTEKVVSVVSDAPVNEPVLCNGIKADGKKCTLKAKENGYCGRHGPDKPATTTKKHTSDHICYATTKTGKCQQKGTIKPQFALFHYCKRHSEKWSTFEKDLDDSQILKHPESEPE